MKTVEQKLLTLGWDYGIWLTPDYFLFTNREFSLTWHLDEGWIVKYMDMDVKAKKGWVLFERTKLEKGT